MARRQTGAKQVIIWTDGGPIPRRIYAARGLDEVK